MAYCKSCGAYIPDGSTICLACGFDETAAAVAATAKQAGPVSSAQSDDLRDVLERHRKLQQEKSRQWAESEKARREKQAEDRRWAQEEYAKRQAARELEEEQRRREQAERRRLEEEARQRRQAELRHQAAQQQRTVYNETTRSASGSGNRALAALSYLSVLFILPFMLTPDDNYAKFHAKQGLRLFILGAIADILSALPFGWILQIFRIYCIVKGIGNALNGRRDRLPYIGNIGND